MFDTLILAAIHFGLYIIIFSSDVFVFLEYFIIEDGVIWGEIDEVLRKKVEEGVKVYVMYDDVGSMPKVSPDFYKDLCKEGFDARKFHKFIPVVSVSHNNRDHRKIAVIDGKVGFMGGANIADEYATEAAKPVSDTERDALALYFQQLITRLMNNEEISEEAQQEMATEAGVDAQRIDDIAEFLNRWGNE